ncbi:MAG: class I SAM-dependent methyltransferase [Chloroflexi bacterium]|nr:class I SAM-dependent methyltransferase [Chloroflexota bacterium]
MDSKTDEQWKAETRKQWGNDPCGAVHGEEAKPGTVPFYDKIRLNRYENYAPWMRGAIGFDKYPGKKLLEIGCGIGVDLMEFARGSAIVTGVDLTQEPLEITRKGFEAHGLRGEFFLADAEKLDFPDESFDVVYSFGVIHHTPNTENAIKEIHRVLKPGGEAIVMIYHRDSFHFWFRQMFINGILCRKLARMSPAEILSENVETSNSGAKPLVKVYSRKEAKALFKDFSTSTVEVYQLTRLEFHIVGLLLPQKFVELFGRKYGWNLLIKAVK